MYTYMYVKIHFLHYNVRFFIDDSYLEALTLQLASSTSKRSLRRNLGSSKGSSLSLNASQAVANVAAKVAVKLVAMMVVVVAKMAKGVRSLASGLSRGSDSRTGEAWHHPSWPGTASLPAPG